MTPTLTDPVDQMLANEATADQKRAKGRGERLRLISDSIVNELIANGVLPAQHARSARLTTFHQLADELFGNRCIDGPSSNWKGWE